MRNSDLYAGLNWGILELLIPQSDISDARLGSTSSSCSISIDKAVNKAFDMDLAGQCADSGMQSLLIISGKSYSTALMPKFVHLKASEHKECRLLKDSFTRHGIMSLAFSENRICYTVELDKLTGGTGV